MQTSPCMHRPWMKHQPAQISVPVNTPGLCRVYQPSCTESSAEDMSEPPFPWELQCESPLEQGILGSSSAITGRIPVPHKPQPGHVLLLQHGLRESRTLHIWQKGLTRRVCQTGKEAQGTVMQLEFAQQLLGHCQGYCWKLCRNELQGFPVVVLS